MPIRPLGGKLLSVPTDHHGMIPSALRSVLAAYKPESRRSENSLAPKFLYTIPNGCNPTGASLTAERKREIYQIAREYDLLILEDDPYYFLQFNKPRVASYLSMDTDGRVLRFDSFSKILSSGLRIGFATGPPALIERLVYHIMVSSVHAASLSQVMICDLLKRWDIEGLERHTDTVVEFYRKQKDVMIAAATKWLTGLAEWSEPQAGMFLWLKLLGINDTRRLIQEKAFRKEILLVPGCVFMLDEDKPTPYVRASFSLASPEQIDTGFQRLADLIKDELKTGGGM
jgi:kynurenine/2-aminoadipate aminotransferase